jgi:hypothetical protein
MPRGSKPGERRGGRQRTTPNKRTMLTDRILAVGSEHPSAARHELFAILVKDQALPADIRIAVARKSLPARAPRSTKGLAARTPARPSTSGTAPDTRGGAASHGSHKPVDSAGLVTLDVLFSIVQDATTAPAQRRKAAAEAALHFLPKNPARGWPGAVADEFGFVISPKMATEYRDSILQLQTLSDGGGSTIPAMQKKADKLRARIKMIQQRLECPCPSLYGIKKQWLYDRQRVRDLAQKRQAKIVLSDEENAEQAHLMARSDSLHAGPEEAAKKRLDDLKQRARAFKGRYGPRLTRRERVELRLLRLLYSPSESSNAYKPDDEPHYHPLRDAPFAANGNLYPPNSRLRPAPDSPEDADFIELVEVPRYEYSNPNIPEMRGWGPIQKSD